MRRASAALLCLSLGSEVNAINLIGFPNTAQRPGWVSLSATPAAHSPGAERWQRGLPCPPRCPGDITALVKQKRNPTGGSCSLKKYQCSQAPWGEYISLWLKVAFIVKYVGGKKMFFYTVSFPSAVLTASLGCPEPGVLMLILHVRTSWGRAPGPPIPCWEQERGRQREREPHLPWHPGTLTCTHARTPCSPLSRNREKSAPHGCICAARKGRHRGATFISTRTPAQSPGWTCPSPCLPTPLRDTRGKSICTISCPTPAVTLRTRL